MKLAKFYEKMERKLSENETVFYENDDAYAYFAFDAYVAYCLPNHRITNETGRSAISLKTLTITECR